MIKSNLCDYTNAYLLACIWFHACIHNFREYSDAYSKTSRSLWQYYRDEPAIDANGNIADFSAKIIIVILSNLSSKQQDKREMMAQKMLKQWFH